MEGLLAPDGTVKVGREMLEVVEGFYSNLFCEKECDGEEEEGWLGEVLGRLPDFERDRLEEPFTAEELEASMASMKGGKAPGGDGLTVEFFRTF